MASRSNRLSSTTAGVNVSFRVLGTGYLQSSFERIMIHINILNNYGGASDDRLGSSSCLRDLVGCPSFSSSGSVRFCDQARQSAGLCSRTPGCSCGGWVTHLYPNPVKAAFYRQPEELFSVLGSTCTLFGLRVSSNL